MLKKLIKTTLIVLILQTTLLSNNAQAGYVECHEIRDWGVVRIHYNDNSQPVNYVYSRGSYCFGNPRHGWERLQKAYFKTKVFVKALF